MKNQRRSNPHWAQRTVSPFEVLVARSRKPTSPMTGTMATRPNMYIVRHPQCVMTNHEETVPMNAKPALPGFKGQSGTATAGHVRLNSPIDM